MYYIGIDGGGTKTTFTLINGQGLKIDQYTAGTTHYAQIGFEGIESVVTEGINLLLSNNKLQRNDIDGLFLGLPGYGEVKSVKIQIEELVAKMFSDIKYAIGNDVEVGLAGSLAGKNGINIVSGTGSIALGKDPSGEYARCGGWGDYIGDEGSAHWIGKKTLEIFSKEADGRLEKLDLYFNIKEKLNFIDNFDIIDYVLNKIKKDRGKIAEFSSICYESALQGDKNAVKVFEEAAYELSLLVKMIVEKLNFEEEILVSYSGGVFKSEDLILSPLKKELSDFNVKLVKPRLGPGEGACLLAYELSGNEITDMFVENLSKDMETINA